MRMLASAALVLALSACSGPLSITGPVESSFVSGSLEQLITIAPANPEIFSDGRVVTLASRLINRGAAPVTVHVVTCWLDPKENLRGAKFVTRVQPDCVLTPGQHTLAPGDATPPVSWTGEIHASGRTTIRVRHSLDPEFWGEVVAR